MTYTYCDEHPDYDPERVRITWETECPSCRGTGRLYSIDADCPACKGTGKRSERVDSEPLRERRG